MSDGSLVFDSKIDTGGFKAGVNVLQGMAQGLGISLTQTLGKVLTAAVDFTKETIGIASSLEEVQNVVDVTFGEHAKGVNKWAENARTQYGLTELQAKQYMGTIGAMMTSAGLGTQEVFAMSKELVALTANAASFYNLDHETAFQKIRAGLSGETEPLKQLGVNLTVANLEAYALANGIEKSFENMSQAEQYTLRVSYMMDAMKAVDGDFLRTSTGFANQSRMLATNLDSLKANIGEALLPVATDIVRFLNGWPRSRRRWPRRRRRREKPLKR